MSKLDTRLDNRATQWMRGFRINREIERDMVRGNAAFQALIKGMLYTISSSPIGGDLLFLMSTQGHQLNITLFHDEAKPNSYYNLEADVIAFDPALRMKVLCTNNQFEPETADGVLEHEIGHDATGLPDPPDHGNIYSDNENDNIAQNENPYRAWLGLAPRLDHVNAVAYGPNGSWFDPDVMNLLGE